jgi:hypothetical protein
MPNLFAQYVKKNAGKGMNLAQIAAQWRASGHAGVKKSVQKGVKKFGQKGGSEGPASLYVAIVSFQDAGNFMQEVVKITRNKQLAIETIKNSGNKYEVVTEGIVVRINEDAEFPDGLYNEHQVYRAWYADDGSVRQQEHQQGQQGGSCGTFSQRAGAPRATSACAKKRVLSAQQRDVLIKRLADARAKKSAAPKATRAKKSAAPKAVRAS